MMFLCVDLSYVLVVMFISFLFISPHDLRAPSANRRETLPQSPCQFYNAKSPKFGGCALNKCGLCRKQMWGQKHATFGGILLNIIFLIANISGMRQYIQNQKYNM